MYNDFITKSSSIFPEVKIITPDVFKDNRGFLFTVYFLKLIHFLKKNLLQVLTLCIVKMHIIMQKY